MTSEAGLFSGIYGRGRAASELTDRAWLQAMLDVEAALARACAAEGLIPAGAANEPGAGGVTRNLRIFDGDGPQQTGLNFALGKPDETG